MYASGNSVERRKLMLQEKEGKFNGAVSLTKSEEVETGCGAPGARSSGTDTGRW